NRFLGFGGCAARRDRRLAWGRSFGLSAVDVLDEVVIPPTLRDGILRVVGNPSAISWHRNWVQSTERRERRRSGMIFALAVFSLLCAVMVWIGLRLPEKVRPQAAPKTSSAVV